MSSTNTPTEPLNSVAEASEALDLHAYWRTIVRRRWLVIPFFVAAVLVTAVVTLRMTKIYDATCTIIIDLTAPRVLEQEQMKDVVETGTGGYWYSREYYETQYRIIISRAVAQRVADKLQLGANLKFLGIQGGTGAVDASGPRRDPIGVILANLRVEPVKDSRIVKIRYEDPDPQLAAIIANTVAEAYIAESLAVRNTTNASASDWLEQQLGDLEHKLEASGKALFDFKKSHDIVATSWEDRQGMVSQRLTTINDALTRARVKKAELQARNEAIEALGKAVERNPSELESIQPLATSTAIQSLKMRYLDTRTECADLRLRYLSDHPKLEACDKKLALVKQGLEEQTRDALNAARQEYQEIAKTERNLLTLLNDTKADAFGLNQYERDYLELKRTYDNNQRLYELVLKRLKDTGVTGLLQVSNVRILDRARPSSSPVRPSTQRNLGLALVIGLLGGIALAFGAEYLDTSITSVEQVEERLGLTFLGIIPSIERNKDGSAEDLVVHTHPKSAAAECLRAVRTNLLFMSPDKPLRIILVTSSGPQEGKTTTATSLATTMAGSGNRVLLVDADMRRPRIHRIFGAANSTGLSSLVLGEGSLGETIRATVVPNLSILPCGPVPPNPAELLHTGAFRRLVAEMAERFDRVIVDSPPVSVVADAVVMSTHADGTLVVLKAGRTSRDVARQAVRQLRDVNAHILGAVLNDLDLQNEKYGKYSYYYQYGYYYGDAKGAGKKPPAAEVA